MTIEKRLAAGGFSAVTGRTLTGYPVLWDVEANIGGQFTETFQRGAFTRSLADKAGREKLILVDHDGSQLLGRVGVNATMVEDARGLKVTVDLPSTALADEIRGLQEADLLGGWSLGFQVPPTGDTWTAGNKRTIVEANIIEASVIRAHAAYVETKGTTSLRSLHASAEADLRNKLYLHYLGGAH
ncbi:HK97 family phage prohead protease [Rhizobium sp. BR 315]|uniref:HK97 family phage prohead protease n=1 Tax=Rhizobium sp. BR 315 TaxID=3040014 RepID=UPI003D3532B5